MWETKMTMINGQTSTFSVCLSSGDADLINGDATSVRVVAEKNLGESPCKVRDVKVNGNEVKVTSLCLGK